MKAATTAALLTLLAPGISLAGPLTQKEVFVPSVTVVGTGEATSRPDMAEIQVGVVTRAARAAQALEDNNKAMNKLFRTLTTAGIARNDLQTSSFSVAPQYRYSKSGEEPPQIIGYQVSNQVRVKVRQLASLGQVLDALVEAGANNVQGISFSVADPTRLLDEARRQAMADAHRKAELYSRAAAVNLGRVLTIQEQTPEVPRPFFMAAARAENGVPVAPGEQQFRATVTVTYALAEGEH